MNMAEQNEIELVLEKRGPIYGPFLENARISQGIKKLIKTSINYKNLGVSQEEALDMIALKISRIVCGAPYYKDNWVDIAGYATLIANRIDGEKKDGKWNFDFDKAMLNFSKTSAKRIPSACANSVEIP